MRLQAVFYFALFALPGCGQYQAAKGLSPFGDAGLGAPQCKGEFQQQAIYGTDNRLEWYASAGVAKDYWAQATVALMSPSALIPVGSDYLINGPRYGDAQGLCPGTSFEEQPQASFCSGFLVSDTRVVTAGHCVTDQVSCDSTKFVFNYAKRYQDQTQFSVSVDDVYSCKRVVVSRNGEDDFAVIELDRPVVDHVPLNIRRSGQVQPGETLMLIGHPSGIPSKIAGGGTVYSSSDRIIVGVDAFAGNSGSVVVNQATGLVEGILVAGEPDFINSGTCRTENRCIAGTCAGEVVTPISQVAEFIPDITYQAPQIICP